MTTSTWTMRGAAVLGAVALLSSAACSGGDTGSGEGTVPVPAGSSGQLDPSGQGPSVQGEPPQQANQEPLPEGNQGPPGGGQQRRVNPGPPVQSEPPDPTISESPTESPVNPGPPVDTTPPVAPSEPEPEPEPEPS